MRFREADKLLTSKGFVPKKLPRKQKGSSHVRYTHPTYPMLGKLSIPDHSGDLSPNVKASVKRILRKLNELEPN